MKTNVVVAKGYIFSIVQHEYINATVDVVLVQKRRTECGIKFDGSDEGISPQQMLNMLLSIDSRHLDRKFRLSDTAQLSPGEEYDLSWRYPGQKGHASAPIFNGRWLRRWLPPTVKR